MIWIAPSEKDPATAALEKRLWDATAADANKMLEMLREAGRVSIGEKDAVPYTGKI